MRVNSIGFCGVRTKNFDEMAHLFDDIMGLASTRRTDDMLIWRLPDGGLVEVFAEEEPEHTHFTDAPVVGFGVDNLIAARQELQAAGIELMGDIVTVGDRGYAFFKGPDGNVYELTGPLTASAERS